MKKQIITLAVGFISICQLPCYILHGQNIAINTDGTAAETGVMLHVKGTNLITAPALQSIFQVTSLDASTAALKLRLGLYTNATAALRYGIMDVWDATAGAYSNLAIQPLGGNVGIGTTSPLGKLHVYGDLYVGNGTATYPSTPAGSYSNIILKGNTLDARLVMTDGSGNFQQYLNSYYETGVGHKYTTTATAARFSTSGGTFGFYVAPSGTAGNIITWTNGLFIDNSGNVGINTTTPAAKLEVVGASGSTIKIVDTNQGTGKVLTSDATGQGSWQPLSSAGCTPQIQVFTANGTWIWPAGVNVVWVSMVGGGGGGGGGDNTSTWDGGGGGGGKAFIRYPVVVSANVAVTVGSGGGSAIATSGSNGGTSSFGSLSAAGGFGGTPGTGTNMGFGGNSGGGVSGSSAVNNAGDTSPGDGLGSAGGGGGPGNAPGGGSGGYAGGPNGSNGGGGGSSSYGMGGTGGGAGAGNPGNGYGAGGGGGRGMSGSGFAGGAGSAGLVIVEWIQ